MSKVTRFAAQGMTLTTAESIANAAICHAFNSDFPPVTVVVLDSAGHVVVSKRMDGCPPMGIPQFAHAKANTCLITNLRLSSDFRQKYVSENNQQKICQLNSMVAMMAEKGGMAPFPGGCLILERRTSELLGGQVSPDEDETRVVIGAIGVSGAAGLEDEECAKIGVSHYETGKP